ncbi:hypothetical protein Bca52824_032140 [Brassica carinata]|uniref:DUF4283 domain-containing protein n=1 Tax=Brassica carinata TaxID=52824 RepID=A0A8X7SGA3_BRACI|nr:hypothetical protein Bca52824_032140 [Brassica carinata]
MRAPHFDPTDLIKENMLTLVGRLTNPKEQTMSAVLPYLARKWNLLEPSSGSDLGNGFFQFRFSKEEDIWEALNNRPYQFGRWMVIIPFWISLRGIPLHYWHEKVVRNIGLELGELETYEVTKSTARVRVVIDGLKPLIMEAAMDYDSGEESIISLDYENLGNHCSICYRLSHLQSQCPERPTNVANRMETNVTEQINRQRSHTPPLPSSWETRAPSTRHNKPFQQHLDRHRRPFGNRVSSASFRSQGPRNKITPSSLQQNNTRQAQTRLDQSTNEYSLPPYTRRRFNNQDERHGDGSIGERKHNSPVLQWRAKSPVLSHEVTPPSAPLQPPRPSVKHNLEVVMEEIREATLQYRNCPDPMESAARNQRILQSDMNGDVEEAATQILQASASATRARLESIQPTETLIPATQEDVTAETSVMPTRKRGRPPKTKERRTTVRVSPKTYSGMGSRKRNLARLQGSPGTTSRVGSRNGQRAASLASNTTPLIVLIPASLRKTTDFLD